MSFVWNGVSSDTMKFNVTSRQVYNAPAFDLNAVEVPGRSGDLLNPQNRFKNKQVTYTGFLKASDFEGSTWREKLSTGLIQLKGWLCSDAGAYHELTDDYDPGFTRYGYISGETAISDIEDRPFGVTLTVTFNCKPFMYKAGEPMELPEVKTVGPAAIASFRDGAQDAPLKSLVFNIEPVQDLHGYSYPWPAGGGKNLLQNTGTSKTENGITWTVNADGTIHAQGTSSGNSTFVVNTFDFVSGTSYILSGSPAGGAATTRWQIQVLQQLDSSAAEVEYGTGATISNLSGQYYIRCVVRSGNTVNFDFKPMIRLSSVSDATFSPYSNICPISGRTQVDGKHSGADMTDYTPITISLGQTVYGGTLDVVRGKLVVDRRYMLITQDTAKSHLTANSTKWYIPASDMRRSSDYVADGFICNRLITTASAYATDENVPFISGYPAGGTYPGQNWIYFSDGVSTTINEINTWLSDNPLQVVYKLATPLEYDLTPQTIKTLLGINNIWADSGDTTLEYPIPTESPYPFESRPLYEITMAGTGTLAVNGKEWTITDYTGTLYCDTEAMEWYDASQLRNNIVSGDGWPVFEAGENSVSYTGDITKVMVTPRWRTL